MTSQGSFIIFGDRDETLYRALGRLSEQNELWRDFPRLCLDIVDDFKVPARRQRNVVLFLESGNLFMRELVELKQLHVPTTFFSGRGFGSTRSNLANLGLNPDSFGYLDLKNLRDELPAFMQRVQDDRNAMSQHEQNRASVAAQTGTAEIPAEDSLSALLHKTCKGYSLGVVEKGGHIRSCAVYGQIEASKYSGLTDPDYADRFAVQFFLAATTEEAARASEELTRLFADKTGIASIGFTYDESTRQTSALFPRSEHEKVVAMASALHQQLRRNTTLDRRSHQSNLRDLRQ
ncbi:MAG: hypothetical protein P4M15_02640 [Alphaproteobacteria bacterium]|nr:hypothetical protein [Alphaproteobacteria bacterium]